MCDEAKTNVFCDVEDPNKIAIAMFSMDFAAFGPVMEESDFKAMSEKAIVKQDPPLIMSDPGPENPGTTMFFCVEVEDPDKWIAGFKAHATSTTGTWGFEVPKARGEFTDETKTRVFKSATKPNVVGGYMEGLKMDVLGPLMADENFMKLTGALGEKEGTKVMKVVAPMPPPPA